MHKIKLFSFVPFDRGCRVRWLAHELGIEIEEHALDYAGGEHRLWLHRQRHPFGLAPAIEWGMESMWESVAICQYMIEQHGDNDLTEPVDSPSRPRYLSWLMFAATTFDAAAFSIFQYSSLKPDAQRREEALASAQPMLERLDKHFSENDYLVGNRFMLPDIVLGHGIQLLYFV
ncbi:MAG TPA: glutathione S-transferase family protein, partial [Xanthomonadaceae bacterium]|nr:glutathione S-transferase family protein [Xanthomonadaceae bacterium]